MTGPRDPAEILAERARLLARRGVDESRVVGTDMLTFMLGRERFALDSRCVFAVAPLVDLVPLPGATPPVVGLTRWRGDVLTVLDLRRLIGSAPGALDDLGRVIVVGESQAQFGILADAVTAIVPIDEASLHALPDERRAQSRMLRGVTRDGLHVIDLPALFARQADVHSSNEAPVPFDAPPQ